MFTGHRAIRLIAVAAIACFAGSAFAQEGRPPPPRPRPPPPQSSATPPAAGSAASQAGTQPDAAATAASALPRAGRPRTGSS